MKHLYYLARATSVFALLISPLKSTAQYTFDRTIGGGQINFATGVAFDSNNNLFVSTYSNYANSNYGSVLEFSSGSSYTSSTTFGGGLLYTPIGVASIGNQIYVGEHSPHQVDIYSSAGAYMSTFGNTGSSPLNYGPNSMATDASGHLYVSDDKQIVEYNSDGAFNRRYADANDYYYHIGSIAINKTNGNAYAASSNRNGGGTIYAWNSDGRLFYVTGGYNSPAVQQFGSGNLGLAVDSKGDVFVLDSANGNLLEFDSSFNYLQTIASGLNTSQSQYVPGLALDSNDNLFVIDGSSQSISEYSLSSVPEPSSLILCGLLASGGLGAYLWQRPRQGRIALVANQCV